MREKKYNVLFLAHFVKNDAATIIDHCESFDKYSKHNYFYINSLLRDKPSWLNMNHYHIVIIHYSLYSISDNYLNSTWVNALRETNAHKIMFIQDEYRRVDAFVNRMAEMKINTLFTCVPQEEIPKVYPESKLPGVKKIPTLTGYIPEYLLKTKPDFSAERPIDVGYRGRNLGYWYGELAQEKTTIAVEFLERTKNKGIKCDIGYKEEDRIYSKNWVKFLNSARCALGTESGASVFDFTGEIEDNVKAYIEKHPNATFEKTRDLFFKDEEGRIRLNQISPRVFESICCGNCLILFEGEYSKIIKPDIHFIPLKKDFSNIDEVVEKIKDKKYISEMAERAYNDIILNGNYHYKDFICEFDKYIATLEIKKDSQKIKFNVIPVLCFICTNSFLILYPVKYILLKTYYSIRRVLGRIRQHIRFRCHRLFLKNAVPLWVRAYIYRFFGY